MMNCYFLLWVLFW